MDYSFDIRGNLQPYEIIRIESLVEFEQAFVTTFPLSVTRFSIYSGLLNYLQDLGDLLKQVGYGGRWLLWIDGSFMTNKLNSNDIDVLSLLDDEEMLRQQKVLFEPLFGESAFQTYQTDAYFLLHNNTEQAKELKVYWTNQFGSDRNGASKGIVELDIIVD